MQGALDNGITLIHSKGSFSMRILMDKGCFWLVLEKPKRRTNAGFLE